MILAIETAVEHVGVALGDSRGIAASVSLASDRRHAESLTPMIEFACSHAGITLHDVSAIAVDIGPGLFTGMRVGIATAEMLAWSLDVPVVPVCSLDIVASALWHADDTVVAALDARRGEIYWAMYRPDVVNTKMIPITSPVVSSPEDMIVEINDRGEPVWCVGSGFVRYRNDAELITHAQFAPQSFAGPSADVLLEIAVGKIARDEHVEAHDIEPMYLRAPDAEINWAVREGA
jgi:tRNA threonylcarbamoyladenosine biosynthesis protein TsaB